jgi:hypothetical protein
MPSYINPYCKGLKMHLDGGHISPHSTPGNGARHKKANSKAEYAVNKTNPDRIYCVWFARLMPKKTGRQTTTGRCIYEPATPVLFAEPGSESGASLR